VDCEKRVEDESRLTDEQEGVEDEKVADGKGREARVAVAEDDHDHPCGAEVGLEQERVSNGRNWTMAGELTEYGWNQPL